MPIQDIDDRMPDLDDWEVLLALHHHAREWDGLVTTDSNMLWLPRELWVLMRTRLSLVVTEDAGHDPIRATGLLFVHLSSACLRTTPMRPQLWRLKAADRQPIDPMTQVASVADHRNVSVGDVMADGEIAHSTFLADPLA